MGGLDHLEALAVIYARIGEPDAAMDLLEDLLARPGDLTVAFLQLDPRFAPLREHPRFRALVEARGLAREPDALLRRAWSRPSTG